MPISSRSITVPWGAFFFAILGLFWCGYIAFPTATPTPCPTSGCSLFQDAKIFGISLWWIGGAYFFCLSLLCLRGKNLFAWQLARFALAVDFILLLVMFFTAPCSDCLVIAVFFALTLLCLKPKPSALFSDQPIRLILLPIWFGLFLGNASLAVNETVTPWILGNKENTTVRIYFSPSCPACREALLTFGTSVALYPIAEKNEDYNSILRFDNYLARGIPLETALKRAIDQAEPVPQISFTESLLLRIRVMRNNAAVLKQGFKNLPLIEINGMPKSWIPKKERTQGLGVHQPETINTDEPSAPWDSPLLNQCGQGSIEPCDDVEENMSRRN